MDEQGLLTVYSVENVAQKGYKASYKLVKKDTAYYEELRVSIQRMYSALGAGKQVDDLLRCFNTEVEEGQVVIPQDGKQYLIDARQNVKGKDAVDITLVKVDKEYEIFNESASTISNSI